MTIKSILAVFVGILNQFVLFLMALAVLGYIWGLIKFIYHSGDSDEQAEGKAIMVWGTLALFIIVSVWGLVKIIKNTFFG